MSFLTVNQIRQKFTHYFQNNQHEKVHSASLVPAGDKTLLFTNSGMVPFKDVFLGYEKRSYKRATSIQRCLRAGGKHNDLENVGYTARHHTFFEMLGNFSFGDYFKEKAIELAWNFLTKELSIPVSKLLITIHHSDDESFDLWHKNIGIPKEKIIRCGDKDNFWSMGNTGPCGPCSEIFYDHGESVVGGPPGSKDEDGDRFVEIWNLVFMQFNRNDKGELKPLPKPSVDTGMGLERIAAVMQNVQDNFDTNEFKHLVTKTIELSPHKTLNSASFKVIADHIRSCAFLIADGVYPSNEGRGYVLRRIIRRALRHGQKIGIVEKPFFHKLVQPLNDYLGESYPELTKAQQSIVDVLIKEENKFSETLDKGLVLLNQKLADEKSQTIPGELLFHLYDTYGFPIDLTKDIARERKLKVDMAGFEKAMSQQKERARQATKFNKKQLNFEIQSIDNFVGYEQLNVEQTAILALFSTEGEAVEQLESDGFIALKEAPFYSNSGGQVSDTGRIYQNNTEFVVEEVVKQGNCHLCFVKVQSGTLTKKAPVTAQVDERRRQTIQRNHSATHLLHASLQEILGGHVKQKGSLVDHEKLRFDFSHDKPVTDDELFAIELLVNQKIISNDKVSTQELPFVEAKKLNAMALFGEKYGELVRVVSIDKSVELCGGTHVNQSGDIGVLKIIQEGGVSSGVRRIEAVTGEQTLHYINSQLKLLQDSSRHFKVPSSELPQMIVKVQAKQKQLLDEIKQLKTQANKQTTKELKPIECNGYHYLIVSIDGLEGTLLREKVDHLKNTLSDGIIILLSQQNKKGQIACGITQTLSKKVNASQLVNQVAVFAEGKGGGRSDFAMAGANPELFSIVLEKAKTIVAETLQKL